jgi:hypothetical protein
MACASLAPLKRLCKRPQIGAIDRVLTRLLLQKNAIGWLSSAAVQALLNWPRFLRNGFQRKPFPALSINVVIKRYRYFDNLYNRLISYRKIKTLKKYLFQLLILVMSSLMLFSFTSNNRTYQTECITIERDGYITVKIWDTKKGAKYKPEQARKDAIHAILFSGISGSNGCTTQPPILNKSEEQENFKTIKKSFFAKKGKWSMFSRSSSTETTLPANLGIKNWKVYQVSISKNELRKYLEEQKIIKSLTNGF